MQTRKKFEKKVYVYTNLSCTAHLLIHLKEWYDIRIVKFAEFYESIWDHMLHNTLKISHCTGETKHKILHSRRNRSVYSVYGQRETTVDVLTKVHVQLSFFWKSHRVFKKIPKSVDA